MGRLMTDFWHESAKLAGIPHLHCAVSCHFTTDRIATWMLTLRMTRLRLAGWEINVPFQHKNRLYRGVHTERDF